MREIEGKLDQVEEYTLVENLQRELTELDGQLNEKGN